MSDDTTPMPIDGGDRWVARVMAPTIEDAVARLPAMIAAAPPGTYVLRISIEKSDRGARCSIRIVYQVRGRPLPSLRQARRDGA